ncbi:MAG TPA: CitMHS family transporter [Gemmatimonadaceae bacterium]|nr:CitMHS family transporter [Gemmatimonadaceae bacterium]
MLTLLAFAMIVVFMALIMTKRMSVLTALILVPIAFAILGGFARQLGPMMLDGLKALAPTAVMLLFAILFFSIMIDVGLFEPVVARVVRLVQGDPLKILVGTSILTLLVSLDGDGSTTYLIVTSALLPLYKRLGLDRLMLASVIMQAGGVMNILPWGGPTARAASALRVDAGQIFVPLIPAMIGGALWVIFVAYIFGKRERARIGVVDAVAMAGVEEGTEEHAGGVAAAALRRPRLLAFNAILAVALLVALVAGVLPLPVLFMIAYAIALVVNYPTMEEQKGRLNDHASNALAVASVICAAGILTGIMSGTKMIDAMGNSVVALVPASLGPHLAIVTSVLSIPFTFFLSNDAFYFGVLPILNQAASTYGISAAEMGRASVIGQPVHLLSPLVPSTYLLVGLVGVELGDHQRFTIKWSVLTSMVLLMIGLVVGVIPFRGAGW